MRKKSSKENQEQLTRNRQSTGDFYNKINKKNDPKSDQRLLNRVADSVGHTPTAEVMKKPVALLHILNLLGSLRPPVVELPRHQNVVQKTNAAFEVDSLIEVRKNGGQATLHSFTSSSKANQTRISQAIPSHLTGEAKFMKTPPQTVDFDLVEETHHWLLSFHKLSHGITELLNCSTKKDSLHLGSTVEKTHFNTICQSAISVPHTLNRNRTGEENKISQFTFKEVLLKKENAPTNFSSEEATQKLREAFQAAYEKRLRQGNTKEATIGTSPLENKFWEDLTATFSHFFSRYENTSYTKIPKGSKDSSVMDYFVDLLTKAFSINYDEQFLVDFPARKEANQSTNIPEWHRPSSINGVKKKQRNQKSTEQAVLQTTEFVLQAEEVSFYQKIEHLTRELIKTFSEFAEKLPSLPDFGAAALKLADESLPLSHEGFLNQGEPNLNKARNHNKTIGIDMQQVESSAPVKDPERERVQKIIEDLTNHMLPERSEQAPLPIFYYNKALFLSRSETSKVNSELKQFFMNEKVATVTTTDSELLEIAQKWIKGNLSHERESTSEKIAIDQSEREKFLVYFLLKRYGEKNVRWGDAITSSRRQDIIEQWRINTLLADYPYKPLRNEVIHHELAQPESDLFTYFENVYKKQSDQLFKEFLSGVPLIIPHIHAGLNLFYYDADLFLARERTGGMNQEVRDFLAEQTDPFISDLPYLESNIKLVQSVQMWILAGKNYEQIRKREAQVAKRLYNKFVMEGKESGATNKITPVKKTTDEMTDLKVEKDLTTAYCRQLLLQWENNNAQADYYDRFKELSDRNIAEHSSDIKVKEETAGQPATVFNQTILDMPQGDMPQIDSIELPKLSELEKIAQLTRIIHLLEDQGIHCDIHYPAQVVNATAKWISSAGDIKGKLFSSRMIQVANQLIEGLTTKEVKDVETARDILTNWRDDVRKDYNKKNNDLVIPKLEDKIVQWQSPEVMNGVKKYFQQNVDLSEYSTNKELFVAIAKWFFQDGSMVTLRTDKLQELSRVILKELNLYGGKTDESISDNNAEETVRNWLFENILGCSFDEYLVEKIINYNDPSTLTIKDLGALLKVGVYPFLSSEAHISEKRSNSDKALIRLWELLIFKEMPNYLNNSEQLISDYHALRQLAIKKLLEKTDYTELLTLEEKHELFDAVLNGVTKEDIPELRSLLIPALIATAQLEPTLLREAVRDGNYKAISLQNLINYYKTGRFYILETEDLFRKYQKATKSWMNKAKIADQFITKCFVSGIMPQTRNGSFGVLSPIDRLLKGENPCPPLLPINVEKIYTKMTNDVAFYYYHLDVQLIEIALNSMHRSDFGFIFSSDTKIYSATAKIGKESHIDFKASPDTAIYWSLADNVDLFVAKKNNEERIYALKKLDDESYSIYRVDRNQYKYLKNGLFGDNISKKSLEYRYFDIFVDENKMLNNQEAFPKFWEEFSRKHSNAMRTQLYNSGNDIPSDEKIKATIREVLSIFLPFYDCVTGIIEKNISKSIFSCTLDALSVIPILSKSISITTRIGEELTKYYLQGGARNAFRRVAYHFPVKHELLDIGKEVLRLFDPGFELVADVGRLTGKGIGKLRDRILKVHMKNRKTGDLNAIYILNKVKKLEKEHPVVSTEFKKINLPDSGLEIYVKRLKNGAYVQVPDIKTGQGFGKYYTLRGDQLEVFKEGVSFTSDQKNLLSRLAKNQEDFLTCIPEINLNKKYYGEGLVYVYKESEGVEESYLKMNEQFVPVRKTTIEGHGVRYDVIEDDKIFPVNFNGEEWYFEASTSPVVSENLKITFKNEHHMFETLDTPSALTAPDERGLMWDATGRSYIKIDDHYVPLILLNEESHRYNLVQQDVQASLKIVRFHPERGQFEFETIEEKKLWEKELANKSISSINEEELLSNLKTNEFLEEIGEKQKNLEGDEPKAGSSQEGGEPQPSASQLGESSSLKSSVNSQITQDYNVFPDPANYASEWIKFKKSVPFIKVADRIEDSRVPFKGGDTFIPLSPSQYDFEKNV